MKLAAIYNVWDGAELLRGSMECLKGHVDLFIIVWQGMSNFGETYNPISEIDVSGFDNVVLHRYSPVIGSGAYNEKQKRNIGIEIAALNHCTNFLHIDVDEYYENFGEAKQLYFNSGHDGSVCELFTYFKKPTLRFENADKYFVPFIHRLSHNTVAGDNRIQYPFHVDPTRRINTNDVVKLPVFMHHFSYVRKDINRKLNNSSARNNFRHIQHVIMEDYENAAPGYYCKSYHDRLIEVENKFNIQI